MDATAQSFDFLKKEKRVVIPLFQRTYVWKEENWKDLFDELSATKNHFIGSIIMKQRRVRTGQIKEVEVIDGQQRLTTLSLLLKALYDNFTDEIKENVLSTYNSMLFYKDKDTDKKQKIKVIHSKVDSENYNAVLNNENISNNNSLICAAYKYFCDRLKKVDEDFKLDMWNTIVDENNKMLVVIDIEEDDDEQSIFDTINSAGVRLTSADIIKNAYFQQLNKFTDEENLMRIYDEKWVETFEENEDIISYWSEMITTGRIKKSRLEVLLHSVACIKGFFNPVEHVMSDLSKLYKQKIISLESLEELEDFLDDILNYADIYKTKFIETENGLRLSKEDFENRLFLALKVLDITTFNPYILKLYSDFKDNKTELKNKLVELEKYVVYNAIVKDSTNKKNYNKTCAELLKSATKELIYDFSKANVIAGLYDLTNNIAKFYLFSIELGRRNNRSDIKELSYSYTLEHVMPRKWPEKWRDVKFVDSDGNEINDVIKASVERNKFVSSLGNMTLITKPLNSSISNDSFNEKIGDGVSEGLRKYAELFITKGDIIEKYDNGQKVWNEQVIYNRTNSFADELILYFEFDK